MLAHTTRLYFFQTRSQAASLIQNPNPKDTKGSRNQGIPWQEWTGVSPVYDTLSRCEITVLLCSRGRGLGRRDQGYGSQGSAPQASPSALLELASIELRSGAPVPRSRASVN